MLIKNEIMPSRQKVGCEIGVVGLTSNIFLVAGKLIMGAISGSVAVLADGFNNLADCVSSVITIIGFRFSSKAKDRNHPYGHGRMEYISGLIISMLIMATAVSFGQVVLTRIIHPQPVTVSPLLFLITALAIAVKLVLAFFTRYKNRGIQSTTLIATMKDSFSDALVTSITLLSLIITPFTDFPFDSLAGMVVAVFIMWSGITSFTENFNLLLGEGANEELSIKIKDIVLKYVLVEDIKNMAVHDYGPDSRIAIIQVSLNQSTHPASVQQVLAMIKEELKEHLGLESTLYWVMEPRMI
jgi:cation diffusion facilitator family transporter